MIEVVVEAHAERDKLRGLEIVEPPPTLRRFTTRFWESQRGDRQ